jgi:hypothetical protein
MSPPESTPCAKRRPNSAAAVMYPSPRRIGSECLMLKKEYRTYLQYRVYLLAQLAQANKDMVGRHDRNCNYQEGQVDALTIALEEHDRLFRAGQPA